MSTVSALLPRHVFGLKGDVKDNIHYVDEMTVLYPAGHNTVIYHTEQKSQKFIPGTADTLGITALALATSRKFVAVAEKADRGLITVFDLHTLKRRKVLSTPDSGAADYVSLAFSADDKFLASLSGDPGWTLVLWIWEKSKVQAVVKVAGPQNLPVYQVAFSPTDSNLMSVVGQQVFKTLKAVDNKLVPSSLSKREPQNYTCHCWIPDDRERCVVATDSGELLVIEGSEVKSTIPYGSEGVSITSMVAFSKGFVCGCDGGMLMIFEKLDDKEGFKKTKSFRIEHNAVKINNLTVSPSEESLICSLENNQIFVLGLSISDILKTDEMNFELFSQSFHLGGITGLDTCVRKPLIATCGMDKSVRIWNYLEKNNDVVKYFPEEAYSVAFHPSGLHVLVGFADKLRLLNLLMDDIRSYKEFPIKMCREVCFSNGGHQFAAVNGNTVQIYNTYTCENIGNLRGHNGKVRSIHWSADDMRLVSAGADGAIYEWRLKEFKREKENVLKGCNYTCVLSNMDSHSVYAVGSDLKLKEIDDGQVTKEYDTSVVLTQLCMPSTSRTLFAGTERGVVRSYKFPLTGDYHEFQCGAAPVNRLRVSYDDALLFCVTEDSCLFMFDIRDKEVARGARREKEAILFAEEVLVTKSDLEEKRARMQELETQVNEITMQNEYQLRLKDLNLNEKVKDITDKFTHELDADKMKFELLLQEKNEMEIEYEEKLKQVEEKHMQQMQSLEAQYQQKIMAEVERYQQLVQEKDILNERWDEQNSLLVESHERVIAELTEEYEAKLQEEALNIERLQQEKEECSREFEETKRQLEEDADREIEELKEKYEQKLAQEREQGLRLKGENGIMKKKFHALQKDIDDQKEEIKQLFEQKKDLYHTISSLEKDIVGLKKEIKERDETIGDKEKRIYDLKKKNQELEKFKFVLDYKIKELKKQIEPREMEIVDMKDQIKEMDHELERYHKNTAGLDLTVSDYKLKLEGLQKEILLQRKANNDLEAMVKRFQHDLHETAQHIQDYKALKESVKALYQKHVTDNVRPSELDDDIQKEYNRQREYLEKNVESLKRKLNKDMDLHRSDNMRIMQENVSLIKEINELRREIKLLKNPAKAASGQPVSPSNGPGSESPGRAWKSRTVGSAGAAGARQGDPSEMAREIEMQKREIQRLREQLLEAGLRDEAVLQRPKSRERLPPMEGFSENSNLLISPTAASAALAKTNSFPDVRVEGKGAADS